MNKEAIILNRGLFYTTLLFILLKFSFSYLGVELRYWQTDLSPNFIKYNYLNLPINTSEYLEFAIIPLLVLYLILNISKIGSLIVPIMISGILLVLNVFTSIYTKTPIIDSVNFTFKIITPILFFISLVVYSKTNNNNIRNVSKLIFFFIALLCIIAILFFDGYYFREKERLPVFFTNIHTHSYVLVSLFMGIAFLLRNNFWALFFFLFISFGFLFFGYNVRTAIVQYFIFILVILYVKSDFLKYLYYRVLLIIPFIGLFFVPKLKDFDLDFFSSGRISMYSEKLQMLKEFSFYDFILGKGYGSDLIRTSTWWWDEKGSHNDFLTFIVENGIPYTIFFVILLITIIFTKKKQSLIFAFLIIGYLITSLLSNGIAVRPVSGYVFFTVCALVYCESVRLETKNKHL